MQPLRIRDLRSREVRNGERGTHAASASSVISDGCGGAVTPVGWPRPPRASQTRSDALDDASLKESHLSQVPCIGTGHWLVVQAARQTVADENAFRLRDNLVTPAISRGGRLLPHCMEDGTSRAVWRGMPRRTTRKARKLEPLNSLASNAVERGRRKARATIQDALVGHAALQNPLHESNQDQAPRCLAGWSVNPRRVPSFAGCGRGSSSGAPRQDRTKLDANARHSPSYG